MFYYVAVILQKLILDMIDKLSLMMILAEKILTKSGNINMSGNYFKKY